MEQSRKKTQHISLRLPVKELAAVDSYAAVNDVSRAASILHFLRAGIAAETGEQPATKADLAAFAATLTKAIESQPIQVQQAMQPALESAEQKEPRKLTWKERLSGKMA